MIRGRGAPFQQRTRGQEMFVMIPWKSRQRAIPLTQFEILRSIGRPNRRLRHLHDRVPRKYPMKERRGVIFDLQPSDVYQLHIRLAYV